MWKPYPAGDQTSSIQQPISQLAKWKLFDNINQKDDISLKKMYVQLDTYI